MDAKLKKEGWIENNGKRPFNDGTIVDAMFNDGSIALNRYCGGDSHAWHVKGTASGNSKWCPNTYVHQPESRAGVKYYRVPWKRHRGGRCPVKIGETIELRFRNGEKLILKGGETIVNKYMWNHLGAKAKYGISDIMAYRVIRGIGC